MNNDLQQVDVFQLKDHLPSPDSVMTMHSAHSAYCNLLEGCATLAESQLHRQQHSKRLRDPHNQHFMCRRNFCRHYSPMRLAGPRKQPPKRNNGADTVVTISKTAKDFFSNLILQENKSHLHGGQMVVFQIELRMRMRQMAELSCRSREPLKLSC
jgi:hypothetical protein